MNKADTSRFQQVEEIFHGALALAPAERASHLDRHCGGDLELRREVESLLACSDRNTEDMSLRQGVDDAPTIVERGAPAEGPGTRIGHYKILQQIGEGGFGVVYMAEQTHPVKRKVALKIIKLGMDTRQVIARFEAERQALALMDHPNIARVLDAGATETGRPYFVMELVKGIPITDYCDQARLSTRKRLELFIDVCHAVQHAHQKGIIHRDIKPTNVLVTLHDSKPVPKVIDFGIAKATSHRLTEKTLFTEFRQFIGTPEYMSPDQVEISGLDVDTRTDIYSLGVLLYELLTGTTPFDSETLRKAGYGEIQRIIREQEPQIPSTRLQTIVSRRGSTQEDLASMARRYSEDPAQISRSMRGDLDWIVMKALEKDRTRRYQTANELADDILRHLSNQPVNAGPPSAVYRLRKFMLRNRAAVTGAGLVAAAIVVGLSLATVGFVNAQREAAHSQAVSTFLQELTTRTELSNNEGAEMSADDIIRRARELFGDDHGMIGSLLMNRASMLAAVGNLAGALESATEALSLFQSANTGDSATVAAALSMLGKIHDERRELPQAESAYRDALAMKQRLYGPKSKLVGDALASLCTFLKEQFEQSRDPEVKQLWQEAIDAYTASLGPDHVTTVEQLCGYGAWLYQNGGSVEEAEPVLLEAARRARSVLPGTSMSRFYVLNCLAQLEWLNRGNAPGALPYIEELIEMVHVIWGPDSIVNASLLLQTASIMAQGGDFEAGGEALTEYMEIRGRIAFPSNAMLTAFSQQVRRGLDPWLDERPEFAREFFLLLRSDVLASMQPGGREIIAALDDIGDWFTEAGLHADALETYESRLEMVRMASAPTPDTTSAALVDLGSALCALSRDMEAQPLLREALDLRVASLPPEHVSIASAQGALGESLAVPGSFQEAESLLLESWNVISRSDQAGPELRRRALDRLVSLYTDWQRPDEAQRWIAMGETFGILPPPPRP